MILTRQMVRQANRAEIIELLRAEATWHDEASATWLLLNRAADELERLAKGGAK